MQSLQNPSFQTALLSSNAVATTPGEDPVVVRRAWAPSRGPFTGHCDRLWLVMQLARWLPEVLHLLSEADSAALKLKAVVALEAKLRDKRCVPRRGVEVRLLRRT